MITPTQIQHLKSQIDAGKVKHSQLADTVDTVQSDLTTLSETVANIDTSSGTGDMTKDVYDTDDNGKVDIAEDAEMLDGKSPSYYAPETTTSIGDLIEGSTNKATPVDADRFGFWDSVADILKYATWANVKSVLKTYFDALYQPVDSDLTAIGGLSPSNDDIVQRKSGAWTNRTISQLWDDMKDTAKTLTNKTMAYASNTFTGFPHYIILDSNVTASIANGTSYYFGSKFGLGMTATTTQFRKFFFTRTGTITACHVWTYHSANSTTENVSVYIRLNDTTDYTVSTTYQLGGGAAKTDDVLNASMSVPINATTDYIEIKYVTPTWVTAPGNVYVGAMIEIQ